MFPRFSYSGMTDLDKALVNQDYLSQSNWTENYKSKNRNIYEEAIFKVEDEMTGFDQSIGNFQRTLELMQAEIIKLAAMSDQERNDYVISKFRFNAIRLSIVEELYQDKAQGMIQLIFKNPSRALPIIVDRIEKKLKFYEQGKRDTIRVWVE
jgi:histone deacetylase complex regulatory component SIN3